VGEYPREADIAWLGRRFGVSAILSLQDDQDLASKRLSLAALTRACREQGVEFRRAAVADGDTRGLERVLPAALRELDALLRRGHRVYLHCNAGYNRAPTVAIGYLRAYRGMPLTEARDFVKARHACVPYMEALFRHFGDAGA
jgi:atypical dual specificity phosphatase